MKIHPAAVPADDSNVNPAPNLGRERLRSLFPAVLIGVAALFGAITFTAADAAAGDLVIENLTRSPSSVIPGGSTTVSYRIANRGTTTVTATYTDRIYLSTNNTLEPADDVVLGTSHGHTANLAVNGTHANSQAVTIPGGTAAGSYFILIEADYLNAVAEENEGNNVRAVSLAVGTKDLVIENLSRSPAGVPPGGSTTVSYNVVNRGTATVTETYTDRIYLSTNSTFESADDVLLGTSHGHTADLASNASHGNSQAVTIPGGTAAGDYFILVQADALGAVAESDEGNNVTAVSLSVSGGLGIFDILVSDIVLNRATISWVTDKSATSQVEYGTTTSYEQSTPANGTLVRQHVTTLADLSPATVYHFRVISQTSDGEVEISDDQTFTTASTHVFEEFNGQVVIEAEHYDAKTARNGQDWLLRTSKSSYSGPGYVEALPNTGTIIDTNFVDTSPELVYNVEFTSTGTFYVWIRGSDAGTPDDTVHAGIDGTGPTTADRINGFPEGWGWRRTTLDSSPARISVPTPGLHTVHLWMREDGIKVDKILLRKSSSSTAPAGIGPSESDGHPRLLPLGDSITKGGGSSDGFGYRDYLQFLLGVGEQEFVGSERRPAQHPVYDVDHAGISGEQTGQIEARVPAALTTHMPLPNPAGSRVLLHAGTNDLLDGLSIADAVDNVEDTITLIDAHDPSIDIYVALIVPNTISAEDDLITDYNNALTDRLVILQQTKSNLFIVDMNSALKQNPFWRTEYMADSVHPNNAGYAVMAETWAQSIAANE